MSRRLWPTLALLCALIGGVIFYRQRTAVRPLESARPAALSVSFVDVTQTAGIHFRHYSGATGKKYMPETVGSGVAFLDYNNDGKLDILFVNSTDWPGAGAKPHYPALYRNNGNGTFTDVTAQANLKLDVYGMGVAVGDYDNDGLPDIYLTCIGPNHLFHNNGNGTFTDVTAQAGVAGIPIEPGGLRWKWSSSATFCDYDKDGIPDLFVCQYVKWTPQTDVICTNHSGQKSYCAPTNFEGVTCTLYRGRGDGTFEDVSAKVGLLSHVGKSFGVVIADFDGDGWPDIAITNDTSVNFFYHNDRGQRFEEKAAERGFAVSITGATKAGMGIDTADYLNNGKFGLLTGNFSKESLSLYTNDGSGLLTDEAYQRGVAEPSLNFLTFGLFFFDFDLDGRQDIFTANGHIDDFVHESDSMITYKERPLLFHNELPKELPNEVHKEAAEKGANFREVGLSAGAALAEPRVGRGCAWGDWNLDGRPGIAFVSNNIGGYLWRNDSKTGHWIGLKLHGTKSTRDGWGSVLRVQSGEMTQTFQIYGGGSFLSQRQIWPLVGLNHATSADSIEIDWSSGLKTRLQNLAAGRYYEIVEGEDHARPFPGRQ